MGVPKEKAQIHRPPQNHLLNIRACKSFLRTPLAASLEDDEVQAVLAALHGGSAPGPATARRSSGTSEQAPAMAPQDALTGMTGLTVSAPHPSRASCGPFPAATGAQGGSGGQGETSAGVRASPFALRQDSGRRSPLQSMGSLPLQQHVGIRPLLQSVGSQTWQQQTYGGVPPLTTPQERQQQQLMRRYTQESGDMSTMEAQHDLGRLGQASQPTPAPPAGMTFCHLGPLGGAAVEGYRASSDGGETNSGEHRAGGGGSADRAKNSRRDRHRKITEAEAQVQALQDHCRQLERENALMRAKESVLPFGGYTNVCIGHEYPWTYVDPRRVF